MGSAHLLIPMRMPTFIESFSTKIEFRPHGSNKKHTLNNKHSLEYYRNIMKRVRIKIPIRSTNVEFQVLGKKEARSVAKDLYGSLGPTTPITNLGEAKRLAREEHICKKF